MRGFHASKASAYMTSLGLIRQRSYGSWCVKMSRFDIMTSEEEMRFRELPNIIANENDPGNVVMLAAELELLLTIKLEEPIRTPQH
jgi:hypothetical protein